MSPLANRTRGAAVILASLVSAIPFLSGCGATRLRADFKGYENAYAESSNHQMLLNLARLNQHHPTYFFKMGQISTQYRIQFGANGNGTYSPTGNPRDVGGGGTPNILYEQDPLFQFIPVNDDATAQQLLKPIHGEHFYILFQQGWRLDQLMRLMVDRIEYRDPRTKTVLVIRNTPSKDNVNTSPDDEAPDYLTFLRISALACELQRRGHLILVGSKPQTRVIMTDLEFTKDGLQSKDVLDAQAKGLIWRHPAKGDKNENKWELVQEVVFPEFKLNVSDNDQLMAEIGRDMPELLKAKSLPLALGILKNGFGVQEEIALEQTSENSKEAGTARFIMRSLLGAMAGSSEEQNIFDPALNRAGEGKGSVPKEELRPLLNLSWDGDARLTPSLVELDYLGKSYKVADVLSDSPLEQSSWNRDMFRIIFQLASQVTVDISKFPLPEILQLRTQ
jgi:hypothetical protein